MSELHKFIFDGLPVRGGLVLLTDAWQELLARRADNRERGGYPPSVAEALGQMTAAAVLMQGSIQFDGALVLQIQGDGPLRLAVAEVQADLRLRATATLAGPAAQGLTLRELVCADGQGRCAITLEPRERRPGQHAYQGVVPLTDAAGQPLDSIGAMLEHYMRQSEQLDTTLVLAAGAQAAAGLMLQRLPVQGQHNLAQGALARDDREGEDDFARLTLLARSLKREELLGLDADTILRRLFWDERLLRLDSLRGARAPRFACSCSRARMAAMLTGLGRTEVEAVLDERGAVEVGCDFCGRQERFDAVDVARLFTPAEQRVPQPPIVQ